MRWSTENENILWRTIFQTQTLNIELDKVSEAWPGDEKPSPKALKEKLDKYRRTASNNVTFSMGENPNGPSPKKRRARKSIAASATESSPTPDDQPASSGTQNGSAGVSLSSPIAGGDHTGGPGATANDGNRTGRGRGRPRKNPVKNTPVKNNTLQEDDQLDAAVEPVSKKVKTDGTSMSPSHSTIEIQVPDTPLSARFKTKNSKENTRPRLETKRKLSFHDIKDTEEYIRCGQGVNCEGACCGNPSCVDCFGDVKDELDRL